MDDYLTYLKSIQRSEKTIDSYRSDLEIFFVWCLQNTDNKYFITQGKNTRDFSHEWFKKINTIEHDNTDYIDPPIICGIHLDKVTQECLNDEFNHLPNMSVSQMEMLVQSMIEGGNAIKISECAFFDSTQKETLV